MTRRAPGIGESGGGSPREGGAGELDALVELSRSLGRDLRLVQGNGGNTSVKDASGENLWVKASGCSLAEVSRERGWVRLPLGPLREALAEAETSGLDDQEAQDLSVRLVGELLDPGGPRPSLEVSFHAFLPGAIAHTHPILPNLWSCLEEGPELLREALGRPVGVAPYRPPGLALGTAVRKAAEVAGPEVVLLRSHGLLTQGPEAGSALARTCQLQELSEQVFGTLPEEELSPGGVEAETSALVRELLGLLGAEHPELSLAPVSYPVTRRSLADPDLAPRPGLALTPDEVVYGLHRVVPGPARAEALVAAWEAAGSPRRCLFLPEGREVLALGPGSRTTATQSAYLLAQGIVRERARGRGVLRTLGVEEIAFLEAMESEKYRQALLQRERAEN